LLLSVLALLCVSVPAFGQVPTIAVGETVYVVAPHDGAGATGYLIRINGQDSPVAPAASVQSGEIVQFSLSVVAVNATSQAPSDAITVAVVLPPAPVPEPEPVLQSCPYTSPQGESSTKPIGDDSVRGWNLVDFDAIEDVRRHYGRMNQLKAWGFDPQVLAIDPILKRVYIYAPCTGYREVSQ
jgi:hypothetical protein